ncbi:MAG TPA: hypothetical protein VEQ60_21275 [Longimicrobium sp.]|nr:hypothetical protein [Longimicrobium sp.]
MKILYCWRCKQDRPMLDDDEWAVVLEAHRTAPDDPDRALAVLERERVRRGLPPLARPAADASFTARRMWYLIAGYTLFTGVPEENPNAVWHHVASLYGPPCPHCGKPLRTPAARWCAACGEWRDGHAPAARSA